jgi:hypothetical protein
MRASPLVFTGLCWTTLLIEFRGATFTYSSLLYSVYWIEINYIERVLRCNHIDKC